MAIFFCYVLVWELIVIVAVFNVLLGLEVASSLKTDYRHCQVSIVCSTKVPFLKILGSEVGTGVKAHCEKNGVVFYTQRCIAEILSNAMGAISQVILNDEARTAVAADILILAIGVVPNTGFLKGSGVEIEPNGTITVDENLEAAQDVYVGGDIARAPVLDWTASIGHFGVAQYHGKIAAANMMEREERLQTAPFFWTSLFGKTLRYGGYSPNHNKVDIVGDVEDMKFIALYSKDGMCNALLSCGRDTFAAEFLQKLMDRNEPLLRDNVIDWIIACSFA